jgi:hypothetical protein
MPISCNPAVIGCHKAVVLLAVLAMTTIRAQVYETPRREVNFGVYAGEFGGGLGGALVVGGTFAVVTLFYPAWIDHARPISWSPQALAGVSGSLALLGLADGTCIVGNALDQGGKFLPTLAYATGTSAIALGLCLGGTQLKNHRSTVGSYVGVGMVYTGVGLFIATPIAAAVGYNRSRPRGKFGGRFLPGSVALDVISDADGVSHPAVNVRLLSIKF